MSYLLGLEASTKEIGRNYKIYCLRDPNTLKIRYIGYTKQNPKKRFEGHYKFEKGGNKYKTNWLKKLLKTEQRALLEVLEENLTLQEACSLEIKYIQQIGRMITGTGVLTNILPGGEIPPSGKGRVRTEESKKKTSASRKEAWLRKSPEEKALSITKMKETKKLNPQKSWNKGLTKETHPSLKSSSEKTKRKIVSQETRDKNGKAHKGKVITKEVRERTRKTMLTLGQKPPINSWKITTYKEENLTNVFFSLKEASKFFEVSVHVLKTWVKQGNINKNQEIKIKAEKWTRLPKKNI